MSDQFHLSMISFCGIKFSLHYLVVSFEVICFSLLLLLQAGTYMYHAHYGMQLGDGIYGMIRVKAAHKEPFSYSSEHEILLSDWYHKNAYEHAIDLSSEPFVWVGEPNVR